MYVIVFIVCCINVCCLYMFAVILQGRLDGRACAAEGRGGSHACVCVIVVIVITIIIIIIIIFVIIIMTRLVAPKVSTGTVVKSKLNMTLPSPYP